MSIFTSIQIKQTGITHDQSLWKPNELCSTNVLNFLSSFHISSFDSFLEIKTHKNRFVEKMLEMFAIWIDFTLARFDQWTLTTTGCIILYWIQWYFWKFSTTIIKDLWTNKVNCVKQKNIKTLKKIPRNYASRAVC